MSHLPGTNGRPLVRLASLMLTGGLLGAVPAVAHAQQQPEPATVTTPSGEAAGQPPASGDTGVTPQDTTHVRTPPADLQNLVEESDQRSRITIRRLELLEERLNGAPARKEGPTLTVDDYSFQIKGADGLNSIRFFLLLQADQRWFLNDGALSDKADTFLIRKIRPGFGGTLFGFTDYRVSPDFAGSTAVLFDAYLDFHPFSWLRLRLGKFKTALGLERLQNDAYLEFNERALTQNLTPQRDVGAELWGDVAGGILRYNLGIFNGAADNTNPDVDTNHAKDFVGRILLQPFKTDSLKELGSLGFHFAASIGNRFGTPTSAQLPTYKSNGQNSIFSYLAPTSGDIPAGTPFAHLRQTRLNPAVFYYYGGFGIFGEYVRSRQEIQKSNTVVTVSNWAAHGTVSYAINAKNSWDGASPLTVFDPAKRTWGALQLSLRYNYLKIDNDVFGDTADLVNHPQLADPTKSVRSAQGGAVAVVWIPSNTVRFGVNYEQTHFKGGGALDTNKVATDRKTENLLLARVHVKF